MKRLALLGLALAACSSSPVVVPQAPTTTSTVPEPVVVEVRLSDTEAMAAQGAAVQVGDSLRLTGTEPAHLTVASNGPVTVPVTYVISGFPAGPAWSQQITAAPGATVIIEQPWRRHQQPEPPIVLAWQAAGTSAEYLEQLAGAPGVTVTSPRWWTLDADGNLVGETDPEFVAAAHDLGIDVWPYVTNGFEPVRTRLALASTADQRRLANQLSNAARLAGADGINVDFEAFSRHERDAFTDFVAILNDLVDEWGGVVSVDITAGVVPAAVLGLNRYDRRGLADAADYLALMAYDEHNRHRPFGPTASPAFTEDSLHWLLRYVDPHQVLLGLPLYGRIWDRDEPNRPTTATIGTVAELAAANPRTPDAMFGVDRVDLPDGRFLWAEDYDILAARVALAGRVGVAGTASWRLGFDTPEVWRIFSDSAG